ncbi:DNA-binding response regulator [Dokdonia pacifica]|uniref:Two component transcriptional regulator, LytTR family n=1 Tax=Dokdonia pacifica TaxID=1627892 RepID=A0A238ZAM1_9FLAO|nr:LytTR family DNA-binding domain-containing protein [Dokdonia pacifica]GGG05071.1 DNA-binding response regulator [Dokdonia pacifica]SNR79774.1 two component transcriptional regulator, LytTR family [Dokdonia pacifica]
MKIPCIIIDDEPLAIQVIQSHVAQIPDLQLVATFQNPVAAFELLKKETIALIFLDIEMPLLTGIDFAKELQGTPKIIFTTAYRNYAIESYELDVVDYLLKPISFTRFFKAVNKYKSLSNLSPVIDIPEKKEFVNDHIYVNANKKYIKVLFADILYVESVKDYIRIHTAEERVITKDTLSDFEAKLPAFFLRIHRSYIVNTSKITAFTAVDVEIATKEIPIGASYKEHVLAFLKQ